MRAMIESAGSTLQYRINHEGTKKRISPQRRRGHREEKSALAVFVSDAGSGQDQN
jgi:hypothetical protein